MIILLTTVMTGLAATWHSRQDLCECWSRQRMDHTITCWLDVYRGFVAIYTRPNMVLTEYGW